MTQSLLSRLSPCLSLLGLVASAMLVTLPAHALDIKQDQIDHCIKGTTTYKVADAATAKKLCSCTVDIRSKMTLGQIWEIESYAQSGKNPATLPYAKKMQSELQQCAQGLTLHAPQKPS